MKEVLQQLIEDGVVDELLGRLKSGKEADVYLVRHRGEVVAAKVYKDRDQRNFKNNAGYKEGRQVRNSRTQRAIEKGSRFGQREAEEAWKSAEADALYRLHAEGVRVPVPKMFYEGVLLMELVKDSEGEAAPRLIDAPITVEQAGPIYRDIRRALVGMLCCDLIHGDLSPYNVLLGAAGATVIDFPQMMSAAHNNRSESYFRRDFENIHRFLSDIDRSLLRSRGDGFEIWRAYLRRELSPDFEPRGIPQTDLQPRDDRRNRRRQGGAPNGEMHGPPQHRQHGQQHRQHDGATARAPVMDTPRRDARPNGPRLPPGRPPTRPVTVPEVMYVRRGGQPPPPAPTPEPRAERPIDYRAPPSRPHAAEAHRPASHQHATPHHPPSRGGQPHGAAPHVEERTADDRVGPRRRRRGRRGN